MAAHKKPVSQLVVEGQNPPPPAGLPSPVEAPRPGPAGEESSASSMYLLEMARSFSVDCSSEPVLCTGFFPEVDLLVSADSWSQNSSTPLALQSRFEEVQDVVEASREQLHVREDWCTAVLSFGLVRWWPARMHARVSRSLGPYKVVIDCRKSLVQVDGTWMDASLHEPVGQDSVSSKTSTAINGH